MFSFSHVTVHQLPYLWAIVVLAITAGAGLATLWWRQTGHRSPKDPSLDRRSGDRE